MSRSESTVLDTFLADWTAAPTLPLEVSRARYDIPFPHSWEILAYETPTCQVPIAEFTEWAEAQAFAMGRASWAISAGAWPRRWNLCYRPDGTWGGFGYWEPERVA